MSASYMLKFKQLLATKGYRLTKARQTIFTLLISPQPQSIRVLEKKADGAVDRVTIYRNLELFENLGIVHRVYVGWKYKLELTEEFIAHHHHLSCLGCGRIIDIHDDAQIDQFIHRVADKFDFQPRRHQFEIDGYCAQCYKKTM